MINELNNAIILYFKKWQSFVSNRDNQAFFAELSPTAVGWKTADRADFDTRFAQLRSVSDQVHMGRVNERWIATFHLQGAALEMGITLIKLMERRPESSDPTGLDNVDFYVPQGVSAKEKAEAEADIHWSEEKNGEHCKWLSIWFDDTEAKLRADTVIDVCIAEMQDIQPIQS